MKRRRMTIVTVGLLLFLALTLSTVAADRTVEAGDTEADVTVVGDDLRVDAGAVLTGSSTVINGDAVVAGTVRGSLVVVNGDLEITPTGRIEGDCVVIGGDLDDAGEHTGDCVTVESLPAIAQNVLQWVPEGEFTDTGHAAVEPGPLGQIGGAIGSALLIGLLAYAVAALAPRRLRLVTDAMLDKPVASGTVGLITLVAVPALMVVVALFTALLLIVCVGLLGIPILLLIGAGFAAAALLGWSAAGQIFGEQIATWLHLAKNRSYALTTALGSAALSLLLGLLPLLPLGGFGASAVNAVILAVGLGAVALTQFGRQRYPRIVSQPEK